VINGISLHPKLNSSNHNYSLMVRPDSFLDSHSVAKDSVLRLPILAGWFVEALLQLEGVLKSHIASQNPFQTNGHNRTRICDLFDVKVE
jgi:hypothetical protein